jgi:hypothetical protein
MVEGRADCRLRGLRPSKESLPSCSRSYTFWIARMEVDISEKLTADVVPRVSVGSGKVEWHPAIIDAGWT